MSALGDGEATFEEMTPEVSVGRVMRAAWDNASLGETTTSSTTSSIEREGLSKIGIPQAPNVINKIFPGLNADRDTTISEAEYIMERREKKRQNNEIIELASDSFIKGTALPFISGAARSMVDPVDLAVGFVTGGIGAGLTKGASIAKKIGVDLVEAAAAAAIAEVPIAKDKNDTFEEYTAKNFAQNVMMASVMQVGLVHGASSAYRGTAKAIEFAGEGTANNLLKMAEVLEDQGLRHDSFTNKILTTIKKKFDNVEPLNQSIKNNIPQIEVGGDFKQSMNNVIKAFEEGIVTEQQLINFREEAIANGVDPKMLEKASDKNSDLRFDEKEINEAKEGIDAEENQVGYDPKTKEIDEEMGSFDPDTYVQENLNNMLSTLEKIDPEDTNLVKIKEDLNLGVEEQHAFEEFIKCRKGNG